MESWLSEYIVIDWLMIVDLISDLVASMIAESLEIATVVSCSSLVKVMYLSILSLSIERSLLFLLDLGHFFSFVPFQIPCREGIIKTNFRGCIIQRFTDLIEEVLEEFLVPSGESFVLTVMRRAMGC